MTNPCHHISPYRGHVRALSLSQVLRLRMMTIPLIAALLPSMQAGAAIKTETVKYTVGGSTMVGFLAYDDAVTGKRPGVLVIHEWWGLNDYARSRARQLAQLGYVAFAADTYGDGKTTTSAQEAGQLAGGVRRELSVLRARVAAGLAQLKADPHVDPDRTAAIGYCFGGGCVLELARSGADLRGIVSFHGELSTTSPATEKPKPRILVCHGADDPFVTIQKVDGFIDEMRKVNADFQVNIYSGAVHAFTNPDADKAGLKGVGYNAEADRHSWDDMKRFFQEIFNGR